MLRFLLIAVVILGILAGAAAGAASWWVKREFGAEYWVELLEKDTQARGHVDEVEINIFTRPATLKLKGVRIAARDAECAKPFAERIPLTDAQSDIIVPEADMDVRLEELLRKRFQILRLHLSRPIVKESQDAEGRSSLERVFVGDQVAMAPTSPYPRAPAPALIAAVPEPPNLPQRYGEVPRAIPVAPAPPSADGIRTPLVEIESEQDDDDHFGFAMDSATIEQGQLIILNRDTTTTVDALNLTVTGMDFDPHDASPPVNTQVVFSADVTTNGMARIGGVKRPAQLAHLIISGTGDIAPTPPGGDPMSHSTSLTLKLARGSVLGGHVTMGDAAGREMRQLQEYGIDLTPLVIGGPLQEEVVVNGHFANNQFTLTNLTRFAFPEYEVVIEPNSWLNSSKDQHNMRLRLVCGPALQQRLQTGIAQAKVGNDIARGLIKALSDEHGRLTFDIESSGSLSNPQPVPSIDRVFKNLLRGEGLGDLLKGLLKKL
jgi:hypothetical protein